MPRGVRFFLGTHETSWLGRTAVPLFISHRRLARRRGLPRALGPWALDSGGFTELSQFGAWRFTAAAYAEAVARYAEQIGNLAWAAPMDWMCEPHVLAATGKTVREHQELTVASYLELAPHGPFIPVLQGFALEDYLACIGLYAQAGVDLRAQPTVGIGSVCRRQGTDEVARIVGEVAAAGIALHGFGVKVTGLPRYGHLLASADSMAWSFDARYADPLPGHTHKNCANCIDYALMWRERVA
jgi:hypothetical protein